MDNIIKKKLFAVVVFLVLTMIMSVTASAGPTDNSVGGVNETQSVNQDNLSSGSVTQQTDVSVTRGGNFSVTIPKKITLPGTADDNGDHKQSYSITVKGDIGSDQQISVVPQPTVTLTQANKTDVTGTVTQGAQIFRLATGSTEALDESTHIQTVLFSNLNSMNGFTKTNTGTVSAKNLSAGTWSGSYTYNIALENIVLLMLTNSKEPLSEVRVYKPDGSLYRSYVPDELHDSFAVCAGGKVVLVKDQPAYTWWYWKDELRYDLDNRSSLQFTVPSDASGTGYMYMYIMTNAYYGPYLGTSSHGWVKNINDFESVD